MRHFRIHQHFLRPLCRDSIVQAGINHRVSLPEIITGNPTKDNQWFMPECRHLFLATHTGLTLNTPEDLKKWKKEHFTELVSFPSPRDLIALSQTGLVNACFEWGFLWILSAHVVYSDLTKKDQWNCLATHFNPKLEQPGFSTFGPGRRIDIFCAILFELPEMVATELVCPVID